MANPFCSLGLLSHPRWNPQWRRLFKCSLRRQSLTVTGLIMGLCWLGLSGCTTPPTVETPPPPEVSEPPATSPTQAETDTLGQQLPITAEADINGEKIALEVASTPQQQALGLMYRPPLPDNRGMLFPFTPARPVSFWMRNVPGPLDMVFIYDGQIQAIEAEAPPCNATPCPTYGPGSQPVDYVLELRGGHAAELGLAVGDPVEITFLE